MESTFSKHLCQDFLYGRASYGSFTYPARLAVFTPGSVIRLPEYRGSE